MQELSISPLHFFSVYSLAIVIIILQTAVRFSGARLFSFLSEYFMGTWAGKNYHVIDVIDVIDVIGVINVIDVKI